MPPIKPLTVSRRLFVLRIGARGKSYLYYRRDGQRHRLPDPEGSAAFLAAYDTIHAKFEQVDPWGKHSVGEAIEVYRNSSRFTREISDQTRRVYSHYLDRMLALVGEFGIIEIDAAWASRLKDILAPDKPHQWNAMRSLMRVVWKTYNERYPNVVVVNPWRDVARITMQQSERNRQWSEDMLVTVMREATPQFRALIVVLLLTAQRIGDVCAFTKGQLNVEQQTLTFKQGKTDTSVVLHVPQRLAEAIEAGGGHPERLLMTPRGRPWTVVNAEDTLLTLRRRLRLDHYTLHGLRATSATALKMMGLDNGQIRAVTGHRSDRTLEIYLRGVNRLHLARGAQEQLSDRFSQVIEAGHRGANRLKASGATGRRAAKLGINGRSNHLPELPDPV